MTCLNCWIYYLQALHIQRLYKCSDGGSSGIYIHQLYYHFNTKSGWTSCCRY